MRRQNRKVHGYALKTKLATLFEARFLIKIEEKELKVSLVYNATLVSFHFKNQYLYFARVKINQKLTKICSTV